MSENVANDDEMNQLMADLARDDRAIEAFLRRYPNDARLHFMHGSILAGHGRAIEAHNAMSRAVELAPGFLVARYQLGFFELTSGEPERALSTWGPLLTLSETNYLRLFVEGMAHLIRDEFSEAAARFEAGIALNNENEPMNADIRLLMAEFQKLQQQASPASHDEEISATALFLGQFGGNRTVQ